VEKKADKTTPKNESETRHNDAEFWSVALRLVLRVSRSYHSNKRTTSADDEIRVSCTLDSTIHVCSTGRMRATSEQHVTFWLKAYRSLENNYTLHFIFIVVWHDKKKTGSNTGTGFYFGLIPW